jgi:nicotinamidase-related amidase
MAPAKLDPNTALIVVDLQKSIVGSPFAHPMADVISRTRALIDAFRLQELPVVLVNVAAERRAERNSRHASKRCLMDGPT